MLTTHYKWYAEEAILDIHVAGVTASFSFNANIPAIDVHIIGQTAQATFNANVPNIDVHALGQTAQATFNANVPTITVHIIGQTAHTTFNANTALVGVSIPGKTAEFGFTANVAIVETPAGIVPIITLNGNFVQSILGGDLMTKRNQKLTLWQGTLQPFLCKLTKNGAPLVLTGATIQYSLTNTTTDVCIFIYDNGVEGGVTVTADGTAPGARYSVVTISFEVADTQTLTPGDNYRHELRVTELSGDSEIYMAGPVTVVESDTLKTPVDS